MRITAKYQTKIKDLFNKYKHVIECLQKDNDCLQEINQSYLEAIRFLKHRRVKHDCGILFIQKNVPIRVIYQKDSTRKELEENIQLEVQSKLGDMSILHDLLCPAVCTSSHSVSLSLLLVFFDSGYYPSLLQWTIYYIQSAVWISTT